MTRKEKKKKRGVSTKTYPTGFTPTASVAGLGCFALRNSGRHHVSLFARARYYAGTTWTISVRGLDRDSKVYHYHVVHCGSKASQSVGHGDERKKKARDGVFCGHTHTPQSLTLLASEALLATAKRAGLRLANGILRRVISSRAISARFESTDEWHAWKRV